ncbi:MAG: aminopeptidase P family protein [Alphaproteobacteria bacterium]|nr:aminopeptidase P family protein [Alphaproteobacteria bacterium]
MTALRRYRLGRVREQLAAHDYGACILFDALNIRYATGSRHSSALQMHIPYRYLFLPVEGPVVLFDAGYSHHTAAGLDTVDECRPFKPISPFFGGPRVGEMTKAWADEIGDLLVAHGGGSKRIAIDGGPPLIPQELAARGYVVGDAQVPMELARSIKSAEEVQCMVYAIAVAEIGLSRMRAALEPGMTENELWSILYQTNIAMGGDWIDDRALSAGDRANPLLQESSDRLIRPGELVDVDTDMLGPLGYCADISRTFFCRPGKPSDEQRRLYKLAHEELHHNLELVRPGMGFREFSEKAWQRPPEFEANRYPVLMHGIGVCDEYPSFFHLQDWDRVGYDGTIEENMTLCVESFIGEEGGYEAVKLEQQVLVTANGCEVLTKFPFEDDLLA